jgi:hypothetical protein
MIRMKRHGALAAASCCVVGVACSSSTTELGAARESVMQSEDPIINGTPVTTDSIGTPYLSIRIGTSTRHCSGTILTPHWVLTAHHCVTVEPDSFTGGTQVNVNGVTGQVKDGFVQTAILIVRHPTRDVALVRFPDALRNSAGVGFSNQFYQGGNGGLNNMSLYTQAWGGNVITSCNPLPDGTGSGTLRSATLNVTGVSGTTVNISTNAQGQTNMKGDSGSSLFVTVQGRPRPATVMHEGSCEQDPNRVTSVTHEGPEYFRGWLQGVIGNSPAHATTAGLDSSWGDTSLTYVDPSNHLKLLTLVSSGWALKDLSTSGLTVMPFDVVSAFNRTDNLGSVVFRTPDEHVHHLTHSILGWDGNPLVNSNLPTAANEPSAYLRADEVSAIVYVDHSGHIQDLTEAKGASSWSVWDMTSGTGAPPAATDVAPVGYVRADGVSSVVYVDQNRHVHEMTLPVGGTWSTADLSNMTGATAAMSSLRAYSRGDGVSAIVYLDSAGSVHEISLSGTWSHANITAMTNGPSAHVVSPYVRSDGISALIVMTNSIQHIHEISLGPTGWNDFDMNAVLNTAPIADFSTAPGGYVRADNISTIVYQATGTRHIIEMGLTGSTWAWSDLTNAVGSGP